MRKHTHFLFLALLCAFTVSALPAPTLLPAAKGGEAVKISSQCQPRTITTPKTRTFWHPFRKAQTPEPVDTDTMALCKAIHDGDSYKLRYRVTIPDTLWVTEWARLEGVDCDEIYSPYCPADQPMGRFEGDTVRSMLKSQYLSTRIFGRDQYGRTLVTVSLFGDDIGLWILENGWGEYYFPNHLDNATRKKYQKARDRAKKKKLGRWANPFVISPRAWRENHKPSKN